MRIWIISTKQKESDSPMNAEAQHMGKALVKTSHEPLSNDADTDLDRVGRSIDDP
jgi:hypothetical protein